MHGPTRLIGQGDIQCYHIFKKIQYFQRVKLKVY